jgi:hypothetical protein
MSSIVRRISKFALKKIKEQVDFLKEDDGEISICLGSFSKTFGLPCKHVLKELIESGNAIPLEMIHTQWHLNVSVPVFNAPVQIQGTSSNMPIWSSSSVTALQKIVGHLSANQLPTFFNLLENLDVTSIPHISNPAA